MIKIKLKILLKFFERNSTHKNCFQVYFQAFISLNTPFQSLQMQKRYAAYLFLTFAEENYDPVDKWQKIIKALKELDMDEIITELRLEELLKAAEDELLVSITESVQFY